MIVSRSSRNNHLYNYTCDTKDTQAARHSYNYGICNTIAMFCSDFGSSAWLYFGVLLVADASARVGLPALPLCSRAVEAGELPAGKCLKLGSMGASPRLPSLPTHDLSQPWAVGLLSLSLFQF